jgi:MATE family multidrug resistance protein
VVTQALIFCVCIYPLVLAARPLAYAVFSAMHLDPAQLEPQKLYFDIILWGALLPLFRGCLAAFFSGIGRTSVVMAASATALVVNAVVNYVLIFGHLGLPALGIRGAAIGALIGSASGLAVMLTVYLRHKTRCEFSVLHSLRFDRETAGKLLRYGAPTGLEFFSGFTAFNVIVLIFHSCGDVVATAATIMLNWDMVSFVPLIGFEIAVTSMVGRFMGARKPDSAHRAVISGMNLGQIYSLVIILLFLLAPGALVRVFCPQGDSPNPIFSEAEPIAVVMLRLAAIYVLTNAAFVVFIGALRGAGDTFWAMNVAIGAHWVMVGALALTLKVWKFPAVAGWLSIIGVFLLFFGLVYHRYRQGKWRSLRIVETVPAAAVAISGSGGEPG